MAKTLGSVFEAVANGYQENGALAFGMWGEEAGDVVVVKGEAGGAQALGIGRKIQLAAEDAGFKLHGTIAAIAKAIENRPQVCQQKNVHSGVGRQLLLQAEVAGLVAKGSVLQTLEHSTVAMKDVGSGIEALDGVDNQIEVVELSSDRSLEVRKDEVSGFSARRAVEHCGKLRQADRRARKLAAGTAAQDDLLDRVARHFRVG